MDAIEFVKRFGWDEAKRKLTKIDNCFVSGVIFENDYGYEMINDLKRLVESWELVEVGLPELKRSMFSNSRDLDYVKKWLLTVSEKLLTEKGIKLKQAIELVEKVNA